MKKHYSFGCLIGLQFLTVIIASAQSKSTVKLQPPPVNIKIDGDLKDWGDSLRYYNEEKKINYTLANDKDNLYMVIRLNDRSEQTRLLGGGLTLSIDTRGKKKAEYSLTFPVAEANSTSGHPSMAMMAQHKPDGDNNVTQADRDELLKAKLTKLRNIKVTGFKSIESDIITTSNTYSIRTAINYDADGYLIYEAQIPFKLFDEFKADKDEWAFNFKINGLLKPSEGEKPQGGQGGGMRGGGGGMGGGGMRGGGGRRGGGMGGGTPAGNPSEDRSELFKSIDFWEKYYLAPVK